MNFRGLLTTIESWRRWGRGWRIPLESTESRYLCGLGLGDLSSFHLHTQEVAILAQISMDCERLLARCFENYYSLSETAASGVLEGGQAATQIPAPALKPAVNLCSALPISPF